MKALTVQEIDRLLAATSGGLHAACLLGFRHGLRCSEITGLRWADVDLTAKTIICRRLKNSLTTTQPLSDSEIAALSQLDGPQRSEWVFPSRRAGVGGKRGRMDRVTLGRQFKKACALAGIHGRSIHSLKHALGFCLAEANVTLPIIQAALGHKSPSSTFIYARPSADAVARAVLGVLDGGKQ